MKASVFLSMTSEWTSANDRLIAVDEAEIVLETWAKDTLREAYACVNEPEIAARYRHMSRCLHALRYLP